MSFREKNAWIASITTLLVWSYYFFEVWHAWETRSLDGLLTKFWVCIGVTGVLMLGLNLLATRNVARATDAQFIGMLTLLEDAKVVAELEISQEVAAKLKALITEREDKAGDLVLASRELAPEES